MNTSTALFFAAATPLLAQSSQLRPPKRLEKPFRILVFSEPRGEPEAVARILKAEKECQKILKRRTDWFVTAGDRKQAEIVMEIKASWMDERITFETLSGTDVTTTREHHSLFADVTILGGRFGLKADGRSVKGAASKLVDALEEFCKKNYWEIARRRDKDPLMELSWPDNERFEWTWPFSLSYSLPSVKEGTFSHGGSATAFIVRVTAVTVR